MPSLLIPCLSPLEDYGRWGDGLRQNLQELRCCQKTQIKIQYSGLEGSHSGLVRAPAKRLPWETGVVGSNPSPSVYPF